MFENRVEASAPEDPVDRPLDMTTNSRRPSAGVSAGVSVAQSSGRSPPPYPLLPAHSSGNGSVSGYPMYPSPPDYIARPSVITCASSLRSSPAPSCPSPCSSTGSVSSRDAQDRRIGAGSPLPPHHRPADTGRIPHRHISSDDSNQVRRELIGYDDDDDDDDDQWNSAASKELPTRAKKERRRHERHHELVSASAASRNAKSHHHHRKNAPL